MNLSRRLNSATACEQLRDKPSAQADVGQLLVFSAGETLATVPVHPLHAVPNGSWWRRLVDSIRLWFA